MRLCWQAWRAQATCHLCHLPTSLSAAPLSLYFPSPVPYTPHLPHLPTSHHLAARSCLPLSSAEALPAFRLTHALYFTMPAALLPATPSPPHLHNTYLPTLPSPANLCPYHASMPTPPTLAWHGACVLLLVLQQHGMLQRLLLRAGMNPTHPALPGAFSLLPHPFLPYTTTSTYCPLPS